MSVVADIIQRGLRSAQPAATDVGIGTLYYVTDESKLERSNGTIWQTMEAPTATTLRVKEQDGTPNVAAVTEIRLTNASLTDEGGGAVSIALGSSGTTTVANGGTGVVTLAAHGVVIGEGASNVAVTGAGTAGQVLTSNGASADPTFQTAAAGGGSSPWRLTAPVDGDFSWEHQASCVKTVTDSGIILQAPVGSASGYMMRMKATPSTPYVITAGFLMQGELTQYHSGGIIWRNSGSTNIQFFGTIFVGTAHSLYVRHLSGPGGYVSDPFTSSLYNVTTFLPTSLWWLRVTDDGTDRKYWISFDSRYWKEVHTQARATYITPDQVGFGIDVIGGSAHQITLISWEQT